MKHKWADGERAGHMLSVCSGQAQRVLAQAALESKDNKVTVASQVLQQVNLTGQVVIGVAIQTQRGLSEQIIRAGSDYLWPVKENQPQAYAAIERLFAPPKPEPGWGTPTDFQPAERPSQLPVLPG